MLIFGVHSATLTIVCCLLQSEVLIAGAELHQSCMAHKFQVSAVGTAEQNHKFNETLVVITWRLYWPNSLTC